MPVANTLFSALITQVRYHLLEPTAKFWADTELVDHLVNGCKDLHRSILDLDGNHFFTNDVALVSQVAAATSLTGVPADVMRVHLIEPRDVSPTAAGRAVTYTPKKYNSKAFAAARASTSMNTSQPSEVLYDLVTEGPDIGAPTILVAPALDSTLLLRLTYSAPLALQAATTATTSPIPGSADLALISWAVAFARAKEREDRAPDASWLAIYATEKQAVLTALTPRQDHEPEIIDDMFSWSF